MTQNHGTPDRLPKAERRWSDRPAERPSAPASIPPWKPASPPSQVYAPVSPPGSTPTPGQPSAAPTSPTSAASPTSPTSPPPSSSSPSPPSSPPPPHSRTLTSPASRLQWLKSWQLWGATAVLAFSGIGIASALALFRLPSVPNCPAIFWPTASASLRIYCAQMSAEQRTVDHLLKAISLVNGLPKDHALRSEIDRNIEAWSEEILELAEESFQQGELSKAIATAKRIPKNTSAREKIDQQIQDWNTIWTRAEDIYADAEAALQNQDLRQAFLIATQLLEVGNRYWETQKYQELSSLITTTRADSNKLGKAQGLADGGGLSDFLAAIKLAEEVKQTSPLYQKAQDLIAEFGRNMLDLAEAELERRDYDGAMAVLDQIPDKAGIQAEVKDFRLLAEAQAQAWNGTTDDIEAAIVRVQKIGRDRPLYRRAQQLVSYWQREIQDVQRLAIARQLAQGGTTGDLQAAIAEARMIPTSNPRGQEARDAIGQWTTSIETTEDRPYLNRAEQLAASGDVSSLQAAIDQANRIGPGRALHDEASERIATWQNQIQRIQDQPLLNQARYLASSGNLIDAIDLAEQIGSGRALYDEAQGEIQTWTAQLQQIQDQPLLDLARRYAAQGNLTQAIAVASQISQGRALYDEARTQIASWEGQSEGQNRLQQAYDAANRGSTAMLLSAIQIANDIPENNPSRTEANQMIDRWSWQLLQIAQTQASVDIPTAISIAQSIPAFTEAYSAAQEQIQTWQQQSNPRTGI